MARVQRAAPEWSGSAVVGSDFVELSSKQYLGKYLVLLFYPLDHTFVCPTELCAFNDRLGEFRALDCEVVACSVDSKFSHLSWTKIPRTDGGLGKMELPLLADITKSIARSYGVLIEEGDDAGVALRGMFIVDPKGVLRQATINDLPVGRNVDECLRLVQAFQFTDEHGEVCPIGWRPGRKTMKADPTGSKEYFNSGATLKGVGSGAGGAGAGAGGSGERDAKRPRTSE